MYNLTFVFLNLSEKDVLNLALELKIRLDMF